MFLISTATLSSITSYQPWAEVWKSCYNCWREASHLHLHYPSCRHNSSGNSCCWSCCLSYLITNFHYQSEPIKLMQVDIDLKPKTCQSEAHLNWIIVKLKLVVSTYSTQGCESGFDKGHHSRFTSACSPFAPVRSHLPLKWCHLSFYFHQSCLPIFQLVEEWLMVSIINFLRIHEERRSCNMKRPMNNSRSNKSSWCNFSLLWIRINFIC